MDHCLFLKLRYLQLVEFQYNCVHHVCVCYDATGKETYTLTQTSIMSWRNSFNELKKRFMGNKPCYSKERPQWNISGNIR